MLQLIVNNHIIETQGNGALKKALRIQAKSGDKIIIKDDAGKQHFINKYKTSRVDNDLFIYEEGIQDPSVIIQDYFTSQEVGIYGYLPTGELTTFNYTTVSTTEGLLTFTTTEASAISSALLGGLLAVGSIAAAVAGGGGDTTDTTAPATPVAAPSDYNDNVGSTQSATNTVAVTDDTTPGINVGAELTDTPSLYVDGAKVAATYDPVTGTLTPNTALADGAHTFTYTLTDTAGNESGQSPVLTIIIDTVAPTAPTIDAVATDDIINSREQTSAITGTCEAGATVSLAIGGTERTATVTGTTWSYTLVAADITAMREGVETLSATQTDAAGNSSTATTKDITVDTVAPTLEITSTNTTWIATGETAPVIFTFSEAVTGFTEGDITVAGGTLSAVRSSDGGITWTAIFTRDGTDTAPSVSVANNTYTDVAGNNGTGDAHAFTTTLFDMFTVAGSGTGQTGDAVTAYSSDMDAAMKQHDGTSSDGTANGTNALTQYINQVTGTDIVSDAEFDAGFTITGHATANATVNLFLDNNRTNGTDEIGTALATVTADANGNWSYAFGPASIYLLQATHNTYGSGVHQITAQVGGVTVADRLFLVADGTATSSDTGTVVQNYSVQDAVTRDVFVYYYGDPDGNGVSLWTPLDNGDTVANTDLVTIDRDTDSNGWGDWDYYNTTGMAIGTETTAQNTALGYVTNIQANNWEFHMGKSSASMVNWSDADASATDHVLWNSNTSRLASNDELYALYAANFGGNTGGGGVAAQTVGAIQAISDTSIYNGYVAAEDNRPSGWSTGPWSSTPTPLGHAGLGLWHGHSLDISDADTIYATAVL